jgi:5-methylcytosine-specific restriction endonuclease McrA
MEFVSWRQRNPELARITHQKWYAENKLRRKEQNAVWYQANRERGNVRAQLRRKQMSNATPPWLTAKHWAEMQVFYEEARRLTYDTGVLHVVDHIWPIKGKNSCGLHVPWNLQVLMQSENDSKGNSEPQESRYE